MLIILRSFRVLQIVGSFLIVSALMLAVLAGLGGLGSGMTLSQMSPATPSSLQQAVNGATVLLQGRISAATIRPQNAPSANLVLWTAKLRLSANEERWLSEDLIKHRFVVDIGEAHAVTHVAIANENYGLAPLPTVINDPDYVVNGIGVGDPVVVIGQLSVSDKGDPIQVNALQVSAGTQDEMVRYVQGSDWQFMLISATLTLLGGCTLMLDRIIAAGKTSLSPAD